MGSWGPRLRDNQDFVRTCYGQPSTTALLQRPSLRLLTEEIGTFAP
jgi:hypothetical protein